MASWNTGVRMKSSMLRATASSHWRCICWGSPADCIASSIAWVPRADCSIHWVQNEKRLAAGSATGSDVAWVWEFVDISGPPRSPAENPASADGLDGDGDPLAAADAECGDAPMAAGPLQPIEQGHQDPRPAATDRVAQGHGAAIDVDLLGVQAQLLLDGESHRCEGLVDLEEVDV